MDDRPCPTGHCPIFLWVSVRNKATLAFDLLTQHQSPVGEKVGVPGVLLSLFGYLIVPATIGAVVGAIFVASGRVSARAMQRRAEARARILYPESDDEEIKRLSGEAFNAASDADKER